MSTQAAVILDSVNPVGCRLTTLEVTFPRFILSEFNTHRAFSRNSASSRAIPVERQIAAVRDNPVVPAEWGRRQPGMVAGEALGEAGRAEGLRLWLAARDAAAEHAERLGAIGLHKQWANRLLEPFLWHTVIVTGDEQAYRHFFSLRCHPTAQPEMQALACLMAAAYEKSEPRAVPAGEWHVPYRLPEDDTLSPAARRRVAVARCARVSYLTHDGRRDPAKDEELYEKLRRDRHLSPFEHVARALPTAERCANFTGWRQERTYREEEDIDDGADSHRVARNAERGTKGVTLTRRA